MQLLRAAVAVSADQVERAIAAFELLGIDNSVVEWDVGEPLEEPAWGQPAPLPERAEVAAYLPPERWDAIARDAQAVFARFWPPGAAPQIDLRPVPRRDWRTAWHEHFRLVRIAAARTIVIRPPQIVYAARAGEVVIDMAPGLAFGTGQHQSTRLALALLADSMAETGPPQRVLDLGTGSGILACAAAKLGAPAVAAVDIDPLAVDAARGAVRRNRLADRVEIREGGVPRTERYELILANLTADLLQELAPQMADALSPGGRLIASGFVQSRRAEVAAALEAVGFTVAAERREDEWSALLAKAGRQ